MAEVTMEDGTKAWQSEFTGKQIDEKLGLVKTDAQLKQIISAWYKENNTAPDEQTVNEWIATYMKNNPIDGASEEEIKAAVDEYITENPISGVTTEDIQNAVNSYLTEHPVSDGQNGVSPTVEVAEITGGHRVTITDADGPQVFDIMNGKDGEGGGGSATDEQIASAVQAYLIENPVEGGISYEDIEEDEMIMENVKGISIEPSTLSIKEGLSKNLRAVLTPMGSTDTVTWKCNNSNAQITSAGRLTGVSEGTSTITATCNGISGTAEITITSAKVNITEISLSDETIVVDRSITLKTTVTPSDANNYSFTWESSDACVSIEDGVITGVSEGTSIITVTDSVSGLSASCVVTVSANEGAIPLVTYNFSKSLVNTGSGGSEFDGVAGNSSIAYSENGATLTNYNNVTIPFDSSNYPNFTIRIKGGNMAAPKGYATLLTTCQLLDTTAKTLSITYETSHNRTHLKANGDGVPTVASDKSDAWNISSYYNSVYYSGNMLLETHDYVYTRNGTNNAVYVDGELIATNIGAVDFEKLYIGYVSTASSNYVNDSLTVEKFEIYDTCLTSAEVATLCGGE